ncbi:MAG: hypothetical protein HOW71_17120, partial [Nonomuraea sp.]|nr:hypothetical protein [Nonomuraea sp.]
RGAGRRLRARFPRAAAQLVAAREAIRPGGRDRLVLITLALANWLLDLACLAATFVAAGVAGGPAAAVVALYRLISYWAILVAGWAAWLALRHRPGHEPRNQPRAVG